MAWTPISSVSWMVVFLTCTVSAAEQAPCCYPKQFTAHHVKADTFLLNGTVLTYEVRSQTAYDAKGLREAKITHIYDTATGVTRQEKIIYNYKTGKQYIIEDGKCSLKDLPYPFGEQCVPPFAHFDGTAAVGLGNAFQVNSYDFLTPTQSPNFDIKVRFAVGADGCIPYQLKMYAVKRQTKNGGTNEMGPVPPSHPMFEWLAPPTASFYQKLSSTNQYTDFHDGIEDPSFWFDPPKKCLRGSEEGGKGRPLKVE